MKYLFLLIFLMACGDDNFRKVEEIDGFRILAIEADDPETAPNTGTNIRLFISDPIGAGRNVSFDVVSCIDPGIGLGASVACDHDPAAVPSNVMINTAALGTLNTGLSANIPVNVPTDILNGRTTREKFNGVGYIVIFTTNVDGREIKAFKRISATDRPGLLNQNPIISQIELNGAALGGTKPQKNDELNVIADTPETYSAILVDGSTETKIEKYQVAWFVSKGEISKPKVRIGEVVEYMSTPPTTTMLVIAVVRDDRGGVMIQSVAIP